MTSGFSDGLDAAIERVEARVATWRRRREKYGWPMGMVEAELVSLATWLNSLRRSHGTHADPKVEPARVQRKQEQ